MFVNKPAARRTVDAERGVELRFVAAGRPDRPQLFALTVAGATIPFEATSRTIEHPDGKQTKVWTVHSVGVPYPFYKLPRHRFADAEDRGSVLALIDEAMRVYSDLYGLMPTPVEAVLFDAAAKGA